MEQSRLLRHKFALFGFLLGSSLAAASGRPHEIRVVAKVGSRVLTDFQVLADLVFEDPSLYQTPFTRQSLTKEIFEQALTRALTQSMASEENRILGLVRVPRADVQSFLERTRRQMGTRWKPFLVEFSLSDVQIQKIVEEKLLLRAGIASRFKSAQAQLPALATDEDKTKAAQRSLDQWLEQLRSRYRVQRFRDEGLK